MRRGMRRRGSGEAPELEITTFMNLMVVLVPFLLLSAAFSEITIHDLNLPALSETTREVKDDKPKLQLEVIIRKSGLDVGDRNSGRLLLIPNGAQGYDFIALNEKLQQIKATYPDVQAVTLLLEPDVPYNTLIATMDAVRMVAQKVGQKGQQIDLFPEVSIGDAPVARRGEG